MIKPLNNSGDTIVEVLIAIVVATTVLAGGFAASNNSLKTSQDALEHSQALNRAQGEADLLKANAENIPTSGASSIFMGSPFVEGTSANFDPTANHYFCLNADLTASINATCPFTGGGPSVANYDTFINRFQTPAGSGNYVFTITERWLSAKGGYAYVTLLYKVNK